MIGVIDSGYGGLTVLKELLNTMPQYDYMYLGDSARVPYGGRSPETIREFSEQIVQYLLKQKVPLIIVACNTMTAAALPYLQKKYSDKVKILGVVRPLVEEAVRVSQKKKIGIVGTRATVNSKAYNQELQNLDPKIQVIGQACPLLVPLIEENWIKKPETKMILKKYVHPLKTHHIDTLILGCTHYPMLHKEFQRIMGKNIRVLNSGKIVAESLKEYLERHPEVEKKLTKKGLRKFLTTDDAGRFEEFSKKFLGHQSGVESAKYEIKKISL